MRRIRVDPFLLLVTPDLIRGPDDAGGKGSRIKSGMTKN